MRVASSWSVLVARVFGEVNCSQPLRLVDERTTFGVRQLFPRHAELL